MLDWIFFKGAIVGFLIAAPVGPINILVIRRTLVHGRLAGLFSGLGSALADTIFGAIAAFGIVILKSFMEERRDWIALAGAVILLVMWAKLLNRPAPRMAEGKDPTGLIADFTSALALTLTNPITILSFLAIFAAFGVRADGTVAAEDWLLIAGVFAGAAVWWLVVVEAVHYFRDRFTTTGLTWANKIAAWIIFAFAMGVLVEMALRRLGYL
ncbi:MAG: LysE family transporter [Azospirillum sp.]|jgi:threonine/homoserine/homoserine lactone efflux protein|nr:LysE family transporter [Azospirillum sp.]MCZ8123441.1 LysE family transporter [Magnetospirillum sp.]